MTATHTAPADPRRRLTVLVGAGVALGVLLFVVTRVMAGGDTDEVAAVGATPAAPVTTPTTAVPAAPAQKTVETFEVFTTKNPFMPLRSAAPATPAPSPARAVPVAVPATPAAPAPTGAAAAPVSTTAGRTGPATTGATPAAAPTTATGGQATEPSRSTRVALLDVFAENGRTVANVRVNDTVSKVAAGDTFASNFKAVSLDPAERCGRFLYGDDQFRVCKGEEVLK